MSLYGCRKQKFYGDSNHSCSFCELKSTNQMCVVELNDEKYGRRSSKCRRRTDHLALRILFLVIVLGVFITYSHIMSKVSTHHETKSAIGKYPGGIASSNTLVHVRHLLQANEKIYSDPEVEDENNKTAVWDTTTAPSYVEMNCTPASIHEFPEDVFTEEQKLQGALVIHFFVCFYMFVALAIVCDDYFVPSLEQISEKLKLTEDVAGATFMAAGSSAPELFISIIGVFVAHGDVGVGTIVGSAVFNILVIIGLCALFCNEAVPLHWWPLTRDSSYYGLAIAALIVVIHDGLVTFYESLIMLIMYSGYIMVMKFNASVEKLIYNARQKIRTAICGPRRDNVEENGNCSKEELSSICSEKKENLEHIPMTCKSPSKDPESPRKEAKNGLITDGEEGASTALLTKINGNATPHLEGTPELKKQKKLCVSQNGTTVVAQLERSPPTMVPIDEVIMARRRPLGFEEAGLRVMMSSTFAPKTRLRMACKILINERQNLVVQKSETDSRPERVLVRRKTDMSLDGASTPAISESRCMSDTVEDVRSVTPSEDEDDSFTYPFIVPRDSCARFLKWLFCWPISFFYYISIPNCSKKRWQNWFMVSFIMSTVWIAVCSYIMVWMGTICGYTLNIPDSIMGITFLAAGTSVPDTIASVIVARQGLGDMAVSNSIGSNVFDILLGLALPWFLKTAVVTPGSTVQINSKGLFWSVFLLLASLLFVIISIHLNRWKLTRNLGILIMLMYIVFLTCSVLIEFNIFFPVNLPMCRN